MGNHMNSALAKDNHGLFRAASLNKGQSISDAVKRLVLIVATFLTPVVMLCAVCVLSGVYPFGSESFLTEDLKYQYIDFYAWLKRVISGDASVFYSLSQGMGSNTWGIFSYYLSSPFNLLILLFDTEHLTDCFSPPR